MSENPRFTENDVTPGRAWRFGGYFISVRAVCEGRVRWDGVYSGGYNTPMEKFLEFLNNPMAGWEISTGETDERHGPTQP